MLDQILATARERAAVADANATEFVVRAGEEPRARSLVEALRVPGLSVIAEIKRRSPSAGVISETIDPAPQAAAYVEGGAAAVSVLTEPLFFDGSLDDLIAVRSEVAVPVLRKDFTVSASQIWEARAAGADAVLLIVAALADHSLRELVEAAEAAGVDAIVEAHSAEEVARAVAAGARIVGVNNRDLHTFETHLSVAEEAAPLLPPSVVRIAESGVSSVDGAQRMFDAGYDAILVGEALVRHADPAAFVADLRSVS